LAHVLVGVDDYAEIHAVYGGVAICDVDFAVEVFGGDGGVGFFYGGERALEQLITSAFAVTLFSISRSSSAGIFGPVMLSR
jgi:hypothetical protein